MQHRHECGGVGKSDGPKVHPGVATNYLHHFLHAICLIFPHLCSGENDSLHIGLSRWAYGVNACEILAQSTQSLVTIIILSFLALRIFMILW